MSHTNPTLKDIARAMGVSATTVHRALHGKAGVGDETCTEIRRMAAQMGYRTNYMASALKRREVRLAIVLPEPTLDNRYYYLSLWQGARRFFGEVTEFSVRPLEFFYPLGPGSNGSALKEIYEHHSDTLEGLLTVAVDHSQSSYFLEKLAAKGIPITLVGADLYPDLRLCCVKAYDELAGSLAAELLCAFYPGELMGKIIVAGNPVGSFSMVDQYYNVTGFTQYLAAHAPNATLFTAYNADADSSGKQVGALLAQHPDTYAVYASSARHTVQASRLLEALDLQGKIKLIGNDRFNESVEYLTRGTLTAVIDKKIAEQSYRAAQALFNYVIKGSYPASRTLQVEPAVILAGNAAFNARGLNTP